MKRSLSCQVSRHEIPVHQLVEVVSDVAGTCIAEINIIRMFPDIQRQKRLLALRQWVVCVPRLRDFQRPCFFNEPRPTAPKLSRRRRRKFSLKHIVATKSSLNLSQQVASRSAAATCLQTAPEKRVIPNLSRIVKNACLITKS